MNFLEKRILIILLLLSALSGAEDVLQKYKSLMSSGTDASHQIEAVSISAVENHNPSAQPAKNLYEEIKEIGNLKQGTF